MPSWRDSILNDFVVGVNRLTLVADPDSLLSEEKLALQLRERGFDLIEFNDPIEFRYAYESKYRTIWDQGNQTDLVVILRLQDSELESLPYDLLQAGRKLAYNLGDLFPNLSYPVIEKVNRSLLDLIYDAQLKSSPDRMGDNATKDFILRHVFGIATELITDDVDILRVLLRQHYGNVQLPHILGERIVQLLHTHNSFRSWPLDDIVYDDQAFYLFLQERWPIFLSRLNSGNRICENNPEYGLNYPGPPQLPFDHQDVRVYIDNLFVERKLTPIQSAGFQAEDNSWIQSGIINTDNNDDKLPITRLFDLVENDLPTIESRHGGWITFAKKWAELSSLVHCGSDATFTSRLKEISDIVNTTFADWLRLHYSSLINLPPTNPAMLHHVPRRLARDIEDSKNNRVALIVVDGLALDQWVTIRQLLQVQNNDLVIRESATFAWIPTLTSVSRQSIFSGKPPLYFPSTINSTHNEEKQWKQFWEGHGLSRLDISYQRGLGDGNSSEILDKVIHPGKTRVVGLVVDKIDKIMHGMQLGSAGMHNQIKQWCQGGFLNTLITDLLEYGYAVWLTADHGNIECNGKGRPSEGVIAETRGERVRIYPTPDLRNQVAKAHLFAEEWQPIGLPDKYFPLIAAGHNAFVKNDDVIVGHGGISIEEVIVPFVKLEKRSC